MNPDLDDELCADFPDLYRYRHSSPRVTPMAFGFECGDGWERLIRDLSEQVSVIDRKFHTNTVALQVKEKFGTLRFYVAIENADKAPPEVSDIIYACIDAAEERSAGICEECGEWGRRRITSGGWVYTACDKHAKEEW